MPITLRRRRNAPDRKRAWVWRKGPPKAPPRSDPRTPDNAPTTTKRIGTKARLDVVELYPYVPYVQYLLPGSIVMSIFMVVMIGGGIIFIADQSSRAAGAHPA